MRRILLLVDHPQRDLAGMVLTAVELHRRGIIPYLASRHHGHAAAFNLVPDAVLLPFCREANVRFIKSLNQTGMQVFVLDTEGGIVSSLSDYAGTLTSDVNARMSIEAFFCWGPRIADYLIDNSVFLEEQIAVTGHPRFDFYFPPYKQAMEARWFLTQSREKRVLIATTFTLINSRFTDRETEIRLLKQAGVSQSLIDRRMAAEAAALQTFIKLTQRLSSEFPAIQWILRPHPFEDDTIYQQCVVNDNVFIERDGDIRQSFQTATALIHHGSTTGLEAAIHGIPVLETAWLERWADLDPIQAAGIQCDSEDVLTVEMRKILDNPDRKNPMDSEARSVVESWIGPLDGNASIRLADALHQRMSSETKIHRWQALNQYYGLRPVVNPRKLLGAIIRRLLSLPASYSLTPADGSSSKTQRDITKAFGIEEIREWLLITGDSGLNVVITDSAEDLLVTDTSVPIWKICRSR